MDTVAKYVELRKEKDAIDEQLKALENLILLEHRDDDRIKIYAGRKTYVLKEKTYEILERIGIETTVVKLKELKDFDSETQKLILSNPENYEVKTSKESIRINNKKKEVI